MNLGSGDAQINATPLSAELWNKAYSEEAPPCNLCTNGRCDAGARQGLACVAHGAGRDGATSLDCPQPSVQTEEVVLSLPAMRANTNETWTLTAEHPTSSVFGWHGNPLFCGSCATAYEEPCSSDADCPGQVNCRGGSAQPMSCVDDGYGFFERSTPDSPIASCALGGPTDTHCTSPWWRGCSSNSDCDPGATCLATHRSCFATQGEIGETLSTNITPSTDVRSPAFAGFSCMSSTTGIEATIGLPGPVLVRLTTQVALED